MYRHTEDPNLVLDTSSYMFIPKDGDGFYSYKYQQWVAAGGVTLPYEDEKAPDQLRSELQQAATAHRWQVEQGGITFQGTPILTTTADQNRITTVLAAIGLGLESVDFKTAEGWTTLTADDIRGIATVVGLHTQLCFTAERAHHEAIDRLRTVEELGAYDVTEGWPDTNY